MPLLHLVVLAVLQGAAEALPVSPSGHAALARLWMTPGAAGAGLVAGDALRSLGERRRLPFPALWILPLGLAMLAYARALPTAGT